MYGYKRLVTWKLTDEFARSVYAATDQFPKHELYGLTSQLRRAVLSVVLNIVEGHSRHNKREFHYFLRIALGSLAEVDYLLEFSLYRKYLRKTTYASLQSKREECGKVLWRLYISQK